MTDDTEISLDAGGITYTTLGAFLADNREAVESGEIDEAELRECLRGTGGYSAGGGAGAVWTIRLC